jgi:ribosomal protein S18 acetylase RimI-like enzyme
MPHSGCGISSVCKRRGCDDGVDRFALTCGIADIPQLNALGGQFLQSGCGLLVDTHRHRVRFEVILCRRDDRRRYAGHTRSGLKLRGPGHLVKEDALFLAQLFVDRALRGQGIGTAVVNALVEEAMRANRALTLGVVKTNPALRLYERLGFRVTHEDERKFYMRRDPPADSACVI